MPSDLSAYVRARRSSLSCTPCSVRNEAQDMRLDQIGKRKPGRSPRSGPDQRRKFGTALRRRILPSQYPGTQRRDGQPHITSRFGKRVGGNVAVEIGTPVAG